MKVYKGLMRFVGLMFRFECEDLLFVFKKVRRISIHSFFVFFCFDVLWLDSSFKVVAKKRFKPFNFGKSFRGKYVLEGEDLKYEVGDDLSFLGKYL
tara:strand:+ start:159 stop:446 length:288 start_codon:yes stop_codon:yes gene_type:complete